MQVPELSVWYGPDTYMGRNLAQLFTNLATLSDEEVKELHPQHTQVGTRAAHVACIYVGRLTSALTLVYY